MSTNIKEIFASNVFSETVMQAKLPKDVFKALKNAAANGVPLTENVAQVVANAMKDWALEKGATHFTHWFQPMTGITAEKHDSFIVPTDDGHVILEFSGKELIKGEPDASSFPNGGIRSTFEARGYTAWDPTSPAFIKDETLCIPTSFFSYSGESLDQKTPLLRSMDVLNQESLKLLKFFNNPAKRVISTVGAEQEYFLIDEELYKKRKDLLFSGRTLFGAPAAKGQELEDHYFGNLKDRVAAYMRDLDTELWKLGVYAKTKHNEVAPAQHELAPIFTTSNIAADHNQLIMECMKKIATRHSLVCLLHEKPFAGVNGSGKHNNWALSTDLGENLLNPTDNPQENLQFLTFLAAIIKAVSKYADLLRSSIAVTGNDHRLGANEAPPSIISIFLGDQLSNLLDSIQTGEIKCDTELKTLKIDGTAIPVLFKDTTDRNRTSPFAFTGNKFEFRMLGSSQSISNCNVVLNTCVSEILAEFSKRLSKATDINAEILEIIKDVVIEHGSVIFNGNNYSDEWVEEAKRRGLPNHKRAIDSIPSLLEKKNIDVFTKFNVFTENEIHSRYEIMLESYSKAINIEALCSIKMSKTEILPACIEYSNTLFNALNAKKASGLPLNIYNEEKLAINVTNLISELMDNISTLQEIYAKASSYKDALENARYFANEVVPAMNDLRKTADTLETLVASSYWPFPKYEDLLFNI